ncbi:LmeA family phospholipid-binding protein [Mycolicibacterium wolinskyi]|uniref:LmeA family phospholipid-binding protein n=1 Tax=Mycolicibacterium wolinskyi TaxID=59750 RepID=UPI0018E345EF|nr:LmeA family phospholipid-binding protein [Mycolicibacterium wolinskyi]
MTHPVRLRMRRLLVGRRLTARLGGDTAALTVTDVESRLDARTLAAGHLGRVHLGARDIRWRDLRFARATVTLHNVHIRPSVPPVVVARPVELTLEAASPALDELLARTVPRLRVQVGGDGLARLRLARRPRLGHVELDVRLDGSTLRFVPTRLVVGRRRWAVPRRTPSYPVRLPELPHGLQVTAIRFTPHLLRVEATLPEWQARRP